MGVSKARENTPRDIKPSSVWGWKAQITHICSTCADMRSQHLKVDTHDLNTPWRWTHTCGELTLFTNRLDIKFPVPFERKRDRTIMSRKTRRWIFHIFLCLGIIYLKMGWADKNFTVWCLYLVITSLVLSEVKLM